MEREPRNRIPKAARYPLFLVGLIILVFGGLGGIQVHASSEVDAAIAVVGVAFVLLSVVLR